MSYLTFCGLHYGYWHTVPRFFNVWPRIWQLDGVKNWLNMDVLKIPLKVIDGNKMQLDLDLQVYSIETIDVAAYKFTDNFYIFKSVEPDDKKIIHLLFEAKGENVIKESTVKQFCNELLDQQVRFHVNKQFGHIRDLIVEEAFKPVNS